MRTSAWNAPSGDGAGQTFGLADINAINLTMSSPNLVDFTFTTLDDTAGGVAADGISAAFVGVGANEPFFFGGDNELFGCERTDCLNDDRVRLVYESGVNALASMQMTAQSAVPSPATFPLRLWLHPAVRSSTA